MAKLPYMQVYVNDWIVDTQMCSIAARGLWWEMLIRMWNAPERGYLTNAAGMPLGVEQIARIANEPAATVKRLLEELEGHGIPSKDERGCYYSRRMVREERLSSIRRGAVSKRKDRALVDDFVGTKPHTNELQASEVLQTADFRIQNSQTAAASSDADWPIAAAAISQKFPQVDGEMILRIAMAAREAYPEITDCELAAAVESATKRTQRSAALYQQTVPAVLKSWLRDQASRNAAKEASDAYNLQLIAEYAAKGETL